MKKQPELKVELPHWKAQRLYFYFTAAITGGAIMIIEILGAKMLAPYVGTSHFVWTAQIAVTLTALAVGYYAGGRWVDKEPRYGVLYGAILGAAGYLCVMVTQIERVAYFCLGFKLAVGSLLASSLLFFVPLALLAMVGPFLVRMLTTSVQDVGKSVGRLTAVSTLGSLAGTILIGYVLIPLMSNSLTMVLTAVILMMVAAGWFVVWGTGFGLKWLSALVLAIGIWCGIQVQAEGLLQAVSYRGIYRCNSNFGQLEVYESRTRPYRYFLNDGLTQGAYDIRTRQGLGSWFYLLHDLAYGYTTNISDVLAIGLGIGILPSVFTDEGATVDVVEINPAVVSLACQYFDFRPERVNMIMGDGRQFVAGRRKVYDVIVLDAFLGDSVPSHLMTREAFADMRRCLRDNGVLVINCWGAFDEGKDFLVASLQKTLATVFRGVQVRSRREPGKVGSVFIVASPMELTLWRPPTFANVHPDSRRFAEETFARVVNADSAHGMVLTDNYNPMDFYDASNREQSRLAMVASMQAIAREGEIR